MIWTKTQIILRWSGQNTKKKLIKTKYHMTTRRSGQNITKSFGILSAHHHFYMKMNYKAGYFLPVAELWHQASPLAQTAGTWCRKEVQDQKPVPLVNFGWIATVSCRSPLNFQHNFRGSFFFLSGMALLTLKQKSNTTSGPNLPSISGRTQLFANGKWFSRDKKWENGSFVNTFPGNYHDNFRDGFVRNNNNKAIPPKIDGTDFWS